MSDADQRKKTDTARRVATTAADVAIGGTALAADKARDMVDDVVDRAGSAFRTRRREARQAATSASRAAHKAIEGSDARAYEDRTRDELYALAAEREIEGRSSMRKAELIAALRADH